MKIVIVGGGAIGRIFAASFVKGENDVIIVDSNQNVVRQMQKTGVGVIGYQDNNMDNAEFVPIKAVSNPSSIESCDLVLLTVKSFATQPAAKSVAHLVSSNSPILFMQTGLGNQAILREMFPVDAILAGLTFLSGTVLGHSIVRQGRWGMTFIGELGGVGELTGEITPRVKKICQAFQESGIDTKYSSRIIGRLWAKVITYATINTLSSVFKVPNGRLMQNKESIKLVRQLLQEGEFVAKARGVEPIMDDLFELFEEICRESTDNLSSMLQDILNGRKTEIEAQSGAIARYAKSYGIEVPRHEMMASILRLYEQWQPIET